MWVRETEEQRELLKMLNVVELLERVMMMEMKLAVRTMDEIVVPLKPAIAGETGKVMAMEVVMGIVVWMFERMLM